MKSHFGGLFGCRKGWSVNHYPTNKVFGPFKNLILDAVRTRSTEKGTVSAVASPYFLIS